MPYTLITGASTGLGEEFAKQLAAKKKDLILVARSKDKLDKLANDLTKQHGIKTKVIAIDLAELNSAEKLFKATQDQKLEIEALINNAGFGYSGSFEEEEIQDIEKMIILNILTLTKLCKHYLPQLKKVKGRILNLSSVAGFQPVPMFNVYSATKSYVLNFSEALNEELKDTEVSVTTLAPGATITEFQARSGLDIKKTYLPITLTAEEVVAAGIEAMEKRKSLKIAGALNFMSTFTTRFAPRALVTKISKFMMG